MAYTLSPIPHTDGRSMAQVRALLEKENITLDGHLDYTCGLFDDNWDLVATGSAFGPTLRCFAVDHAHQGEGLLNEILTHLVERQAAKGNFHLFLYTKPETAKFFADLGFFEIAQVEGLSFLENRRLYTWVHNKTIQKAVESYRVTDERKSYLRTLRRKGEG